MPRADLEPLFQVMRAQPLRGTIPEMRVDFELFLPLVNAGAPAVAREHLGEAIGDGVGVDILVPPGEAPFPVLVYLHGGGWSVGSPASHAKLTRQLCLAAGSAFFILVFPVVYIDKVK